jgi:hypothetical protein
MGSIRICRALLGVLVLVAVACSSAPGAAANDPAGTVQVAMAAVQSGGFAKVTDFTCAAKKSDITNAFGGADLGALTAAGVNPTDIFGAMTVSFENLATKEVSKTDKAATVHVTGDIKMSFDKDKMRAVMKTVLAARGQPVDDATLDAAMTVMTGALSQTQKMDEDLTLVNEGGKWLIC